MIPALSQRQRLYADPWVQMRLEEYLGGDPPDHATAVFFAPGTEWEPFYRQQHSLSEWADWLHLGAELNRSLWDRRSLIAHLDIEYVNFDHPSFPYLAADEVFRRQEPVVEAAKEELEAFGIPAIHLLTGRGHHFAWQVDFSSPAFEQLAALGRMDVSLRGLYAAGPGPAGENLAPELGLAYAGLGLVMEHLAHRIDARSEAARDLPLELAAIEAGGGRFGREIIAVDLTEYADPLCARVIRIPFSIYLKPWQMRHVIPEQTLDHLAPIYVIPLRNLSLEEGLRLRTDPEAVRELAPTASGVIPQASAGMQNLIRSYQAASVAEVHRWFYSQEHEPASIWPETYDRTPMDLLPPCVWQILRRPNDLLLRPGCVKRLVRVMLALGWHPRHIAGLVRSKYERSHGWGSQWYGYDPATRADFYARVFTAQFLTGVDSLEDFNCASAREEGLCFVEPCEANLADYRRALIKRKNHERLGCRPFNRLFLSEEHP